MPDRIKLAALGGSSVATPEVVRALDERADRPPMEVVLIGRKGHKSAADFVADVTDEGAYLLHPLPHPLPTNTNRILV